MKIKMLPHLTHFKSEESGIKRVLEAYFKYLPQFGVEIVNPETETFDLLVAHAGMGDGSADVAHLHGLYWSADYDCSLWEYESNRRIVNEIRQARQITVPSSWVAETFQRDMRLNPHVIGHGIEWQEWQHNYPSQGYVLWNKNRIGDVCSPDDVNRLAQIFGKIEFISTFGAGADVTNLNLDNLWSLRINGETPHYLKIGLRNHSEMRQIIQQAEVYLSTTKETFGIGVLEAMAAGVPVLGYKKGGNVDLIQHGVNGYLAIDFDDLVEGLIYCLDHRQALGDNGRGMAKAWTWPKQVEGVAQVYFLAAQPQPPTVSVIIPIYNKTIEQLKRAIDSCLAQVLKPEKIVVVNDGSSNTSEIEDFLSSNYKSVLYIYQENQGVAIARNNGIVQVESKYICCLDADDWIEPLFLMSCVNPLEADRSLGITYTGLKWHKDDGKTGISQWPGEWNFDKQVDYKARQNQVPTCCVFRREMWQRLGGYRQRYAPKGAGAEDAEFWTRSGAYGFKAAKVTNEPLFNYSAGGATSQNYQEPDWLAWHPWAKDMIHPFASYATPKKQSHPVQQYDEPLVSVIIPVGPGHERQIINALDSLEAQTFRKWEAIVVNDSGNKLDAISSYPYVKLLVTSGKRGAGYARNRGVEIARAPFIIFLDADDTLHPDALELMITAWNQQQKIIYSDYVGHAFIELALAQKLQQEQRLQSYNDKDGEAIINYKGFEFDCQRALRQPEQPVYIWCNISCLVPKRWHNEIGGFDESMQTWEDWDYWLRMVQAGKCFYHLKRELLRYCFFSGKRRDLAVNDRQISSSMLQYLTNKYEDISKMPCGCKNDDNKKIAEGQVQSVADNNYVRMKYTGSRGNHHIIGAFEMDFDPGLPTRRKGSKFVHYYGYASEGHVTLVHREDAKLMRGKWQPVNEVVLPPPVKQSLEAPRIINPATFELQTIPGINDNIARELTKADLTTKEAILQVGREGLLAIQGIGEGRAKIILDYLTA